MVHIPHHIHNRFPLSTPKPNLFFYAFFLRPPSFPFPNFPIFFYFIFLRLTPPLAQLNGAEASMPSPHSPGVDISAQPWATIKLLWTATLPGLLPLHTFSLE